jgi:FixJ family two-component response regulator
VQRSRLLIAVVEDEESVRKALGRLLRSAGLGVDTYASGEEFLQALPARLPHCLLLDWRLPGINGQAVQSRLRESNLKLPIVFITATGDLAACKQALQSGAAAWLDKPVDDRVLLETIAQALSEYAFLPEVLD